MSSWAFKSVCRPLVWVFRNWSEIYCKDVLHASILILKRIALHSHSGRISPVVFHRSDSAQVAM